jgi:hypothetical protein
MKYNEKEIMKEIQNILEYLRINTELQYKRYYKQNIYNCLRRFSYLVSDDDTEIGYWLSQLEKKLTNVWMEEFVFSIMQAAREYIKKFQDI